jgi:hypothetical protein
LWKFPDEHDGRFPSSAAESGIADDLWQPCNNSGERDIGLRYFYTPGRTAAEESAAVVFEPDIYGDGQLVLLTNGTIRRMDSVQLLTALKPEPEPETQP